MKVWQIIQSWVILAEMKRIENSTKISQKATFNGFSRTKLFALRSTLEKLTS